MALSIAVARHSVPSAVASCLGSLVLPGGSCALSPATVTCSCLQPGPQRRAGAGGLAGVARRAAAPGEAARGDGSAVRGLSTSTSPPSPTSPAALSTAHAPMAVPVRRRGRWPGGRLRSVGGSVSRSSRRGARRRGRCRGGRTRGCGAGGPEAGRRPAARPLAGVVVGELERRPRRVLAEGRGHGFHEVSFPVGARVQRFCRHDLGVPSARCFVQRLMIGNGKQKRDPYGHVKRDPPGWRVSTSILLRRSEAGHGSSTAGNPPSPPPPIRTASRRFRPAAGDPWRPVRRRGRPGRPRPGRAARPIAAA